MARRERTTGLPRARRRERTGDGRRIAGIPIGESAARLAILGIVGALLAFVVLLVAYRFYDDRFAHPNKTVLTVGEEKVPLHYFADRLLEFARTNPTTGRGLLPEALLAKLEQEALTTIIARDKGADLSASAVTASIAASLGVPVGGTGSSFDTLYRNRLRTLKMSDGNYRRLATADLASKKVLELVTAEVGNTGETVTIRTIVVESQERAAAILGRVKGGEDMGTIAQTESADLTSRQQDGLMLGEPRELLPEAVRAAIAGKAEGELLGPIQVQENFWVFRVEKLDPAGSFTEAQKAQLARARFNAAIDARRTSLAGQIRRQLNGDDIEWAFDHAD